MKRSGLVISSILLIAVLLLAIWQWDLLPSYRDVFNGLIDEVENPPIPRNPSTPGPQTANVKALARQITAGIPDDYGKLCAIYDWITANITYDLQKARRISDYGYGAEYLLENRKGVCHDYAELTRAMLKAVGIRATYERGTVHPAPGKTENHAWNHALIGETWYGLDTTWGSGFVDEEKKIFVSRPSRLYLTAQEELARLHRDPVYKEAREFEQRQSRAAAAKPVSLPEHEARLLELFNESRIKTGLAPFKEETNLLGMVRQSAIEAAAKACRGEEYTLDQLKKEIEQGSANQRLAGTFLLHAFTLWDYPTPAAEELHRLIAGGAEPFWEDDIFSSLAVAVICRGDLVSVILVVVAYH